MTPEGEDGNGCKSELDSTFVTSAQRSARTLGEVQFEGAESVDEWINPSSVLGVVAESTDGPMTPPPHLQLRRNQLVLSLESTDGKMTPIRAELMETAEITNNLW